MRLILFSRFPSHFHLNLPTAHRKKKKKRPGRSFISFTLPVIVKFLERRKGLRTEVVGLYGNASSVAVATWVAGV